MRTDGRQSLWSLVCCSFVAAAFVAALTSTALAQQTLKLGVIGPMSGSGAAWGLELSRAAEMRAAEINAAGGLKIGGDTYKLEVISYDHKGDAAEARTVTNRLVFQDKVKFIIGNAIGATTTAAQTITEPNAVLFTFTSWGFKSLGPDKPLSFRSESSFDVAEPFYAWIKAKNPSIKRVAVFGANDESGYDTVAAIAATAEKQGYTVVSKEYFARDTKDFYPMLTRVLTTNPDLIDLGGAPAGLGGLIVKQLNELGYKKAKAWTGGSNLDVLVKVAGNEAAQGTWSPFSISEDSPFSSPELKAFKAKYKAKYSEIPGAIGVGNYIAVGVVVEAAQRAKSLDPKVVAETIAAGTFDTLRGKLVVGGQEMHGTKRQFMYQITIAEIRNGQVVDVDVATSSELKKALGQ